MQDVIDKLWTSAVLLTPRLLASVAIFAAFWAAAILLQAIVVKVGTARRFHAEMVTVIRQVVKGALLALGAVTALGTTGFNVSALVAGLGLTGFALGFALKDVLSNVVAGVLILTYRPFRRDDHVSIAGFDGLVTEIDLRYTTLQAEDRRILVPNSTIMISPISVFGKDGDVASAVTTPERRLRSSSTPRA